jgi:hypothetical protein
VAFSLLRRRPSLPPHALGAWEAFLTCAGRLEAGRRVLLGTLPVGRVQPAPIATGTEALRGAIEDVRVWMPDWRLDELAEEWSACGSALDRALVDLDAVDGIAASTEELDDVLDPVRHLMDGLDAFADAEAAFRRRWRCPDPASDRADGGGW